MASDSAPGTAKYVTDTSGTSVQIVALVVDLMGEAIASSGGPPSHTSALSTPVVSVRSTSGRGQDCFGPGCNLHAELAPQLGT